MLAIRMQRTGRKGHAQYRLVVQDARLTPTSGKIVAQIGTFNPHTKQVTLNKEVATKFVSNGAQPSPRVVTILQGEGVQLPEWVKLPAQKSSKIRNPEKLRKNQPKEEPVAEEAPVEEVVAEEPTATESPAEETTETPAE